MNLTPFFGPVLWSCVPSGATGHAGHNASTASIKRKGDGGSYGNLIASVPFVFLTMFLEIAPDTFFGFQTQGKRKSPLFEEVNSCACF